MGTLGLGGVGICGPVDKIGRFVHDGCRDWMRGMSGERNDSSSRESPSCHNGLSLDDDDS